MIIEYYVKSVYGVNKNYFVPCNLATGFQMLTGKKTFDSKDQRGLSAIVGQPIEFKQVIEPKN